MWLVRLDCIVTSHWRSSKLKTQIKSHRPRLWALLFPGILAYTIWVLTPPGINVSIKVRVSSNGLGRKIGKIFLLHESFETLASSAIGDCLSDDLFIFFNSPLGGAINWKKLILYHATPCDAGYFYTTRKAASNGIFLFLQKFWEMVGKLSNRRFSDLMTHR